MRLWTRGSCIRLPLLVLGAVLVYRLLEPDAPPLLPLDPVPATFAAGRLEASADQRVLHLAGSPAERGRQYGHLLRRSIRYMLKGYVVDAVCDGDRDYQEELLGRVRLMKPILPDWYRAELAACAQAAGVDEDLLLLAQCEGDIQSLAGMAANPESGHGCSGYAVFGDPSFANGNLQVGRNFDYFGGRIVRHCALTQYLTPPPEEGHAFAAIGWSGILGGWTLVNEHGLVVANHLGGGSARDPCGIPTLIMTRILAQKAATIDEALTLLRAGPRMRGQIVWLAQPGDAATDRPARAVAAEYDARTVCVREAKAGRLVVTNRNLVFGHENEPTGASLWDGRYRTLEAALRSPRTDPAQRLITAVGQDSTLHSVEIDFAARRLYVAHGRLPAQDGPFVPYDLPHRPAP